MGEKPFVYITRCIPEKLLQPYQEQIRFKMWHDEHEPVPENVLYEEAKNADGLLCLLTETIDQSFLSHVLQLKIIANMAVGYDNIDINSTEKHGVIVTNTPDVLSETTADLTFALLMATARKIVVADRFLREGKWKEWSPFLLAGSDVFQKKIGIVGMGRIGAAVARRAKGFNMDIVYHNRKRNYIVEEELGAQYVSFDDLLSEADYVVSLVPLTNKTVNMFNKAAFDRMKQSAFFINVSRGGVVDEEALYNALYNRVIAGAGLDVFQHEPIDDNHRFVNLENTVLLPHIGSASRETREAMIKLCLENISLVLKGKEPLTGVKQ